jgi:hypothetical protein
MCYRMPIKFRSTRVVRTIGPTSKQQCNIHEGNIYCFDKSRLAYCDSSQYQYYRDVISTVREDLLLVERYKQEFTPTSELRHIETLLQQLELKLDSFHQILPRLDRRRGLVNIGGIVVKSISGTATIFDIYQLHDTLDKL